MKDKTNGALPVALILLLALAALTFCAGCSTQNVLRSKLASDTVAAVLRHNDVSPGEAKVLASASLYATADVIQGYVDKKPPLEVAANSPGVKGVSQIVVEYLKTKGWITQKTVDNLHAAAQIAANATEKQRSTVNDGP